MHADADAAAAAHSPSRPFEPFERSRWTRRAARALVCALGLAVATAGGAQTVLPARDIDLVADNGLFHYSQTDGRWASYVIGKFRDVPMGRCGCLLATLSTVLGQSMTGLTPWYPTMLAYGTSAFDLNPRYLDLFLYLGPSLATANLGWGYKDLGAGACGTIPILTAFQGVGSFGGTPVGPLIVSRRHFGPRVRDVVNRNLLAGRPTIAVVTAAEGTHHAFVIAGWDDDVKAYKVLDPMTPRVLFGGNVYRPFVPVARAFVGDTDPTYEKWKARVKGIIDVRAGVSTVTPSLIFGDDPSPIEILMTGPDGRRVGVDPAADAAYEELDAASYWDFGPWTDPLGEIPGGASPRFVVVPDAAAGTYHFKVTGVAAGPLHLTAETMRGAGRVVFGAFDGTIAAGEVRKYELVFARSGPSHVAEVSNFTPHANAGDDVHARTEAPIAFDGSQSFDADGALASYAWDFGDGTTGAGRRVEHAYAAPGDYTVTLTVTDADGATATDTLLAGVILSQRRPVAHASGPYVGFASATSDWAVFLDARGSSDPNLDPLTYRWDFGDGTPVETTSAPYTAHVYGAVGDYVVTLVVNDGIDDSAPISARVAIGEAPTNPMSWSGDAALTPACGVPGDEVTITMGSYGQFDSWNLGTQGPLPVFPPSNLMLGLIAPPGTIALDLPGGESVYAPFHATLLSPGRFSASARFVVPDVGPGLHQVRWAEDEPLTFPVPCPAPENRLPVADAGGPYAAALGAPIAFDGSRSSDPDGDELEYEWHFGDGEIGEGVRPEHVYAREGRYLVTLIVGDGQSLSTAAAGARNFASAVVAAGGGDTTPPVTTAAVSPAAGAGGWHRGSVAIDLTAVDEQGGSGVRDLSFALTGAEQGGAMTLGDAASVAVDADGVSELAFFATDRAGNVEAQQALTIRIDRQGPTLTGLPGPGCALWPPNHRMVTVANVAADDGGSGLAPGALEITVTSSEPPDALGDGSTEPDFVVDGGRVALRAERSGTGASRTYTVTAEATDVAGNTTRTSTTCIVAHDRR